MPTLYIGKRRRLLGFLRLMSVVSAIDNKYQNKAKAATAQLQRCQGRGRQKHEGGEVLSLWIWIG
jgi:hypothetical protein